MEATRNDRSETTTIPSVKFKVWKENDNQQEGMTRPDWQVTIRLGLHWIERVLVELL